jgi:hypothetical protein
MVADLGGPGDVFYKKWDLKDTVCAGYVVNLNGKKMFALKEGVERA